MNLKALSNWLIKKKLLHMDFNTVNIIFRNNPSRASHSAIENKEELFVC